jgi:hypothetical protein
MAPTPDLHICSRGGQAVGLKGSVRPVVMLRIVVGMFLESESPDGYLRLATRTIQEMNWCADLNGLAPRGPQSANRRTKFFQWLAMPLAIFFATNLPVLAQSIASGRATEPAFSAPSPQLDESKEPSLRTLLLTPPKPQTLNAPYHRITPRQSFGWFIANTTGPAYLAGGIFLAAFATAADRPKEYGPHWEGFGDRYGLRKSVVATGNAIEASAGFVLREDPRYFRMPDRPFNARVKNVISLTFTARREDGSFGPAYARYIAVVGSNFLSNTWRPPSGANAQDAVLRASVGFAGRMAANSFEEFWPDIKKRVFHRSN